MGCVHNLPVHDARCEDEQNLKDERYDETDLLQLLFLLHKVIHLDIQVILCQSRRNTPTYTLCRSGNDRANYWGGGDARWIHWGSFEIPRPNPTDIRKAKMGVYIAYGVSTYMEFIS